MPTAFAPVTGDETPIPDSFDLGPMLLGLDYASDGAARPRFFDASLEHGVLRVPARRGRWRLMLLQKLVEYSERLDMPPTLYRELPVRYVIDLREDGTLINITDAADPAPTRTRRGQPRLAPEVTRASAVKPLLLASRKGVMALHACRLSPSGRRILSQHCSAA